MTQGEFPSYVDVKLNVNIRYILTFIWICINCPLFTFKIRVHWSVAMGKGFTLESRSSSKREVSTSYFNSHSIYHTIISSNLDRLWIRALNRFYLF